MGVDVARAAATQDRARQSSRVRLASSGLAELLVAAAGYLAYSLSTGAVRGHRGLAFDNAERVIVIERRLHLLVERAIQLPALPHSSIVQLFNGIYIWGHLPLIIAVALWLFVFHRARYPVIRNSVLISGAIALVAFYGLPVAPPRLVPSLRIVDTAALVSPIYDTLEPKVFFNPYAAIPSMHIAWDLLMGIALIWCSRVALLRWFGATLPLAMLLAVVITGNHYVIDGLAGALVGVVGLTLAFGLERLRIGFGVTGAGAT